MSEIKRALERLEAAHARQDTGLTGTGICVVQASDLLAVMLAASSSAPRLDPEEVARIIAERCAGKFAEPNDIDRSFAQAICALQGVEGEEVEALQAQLKAVTEERDEAVNWSHIVERHGTDGFDDLAESWLSMDAIQRMHNAVGSVFSKWANDELMDRFKSHMSAILQVAFVEGCLVGVRTEMAKAGGSEPNPSNLHPPGGKP